MRRARARVSKEGVGPCGGGGARRAAAASWIAPFVVACLTCAACGTSSSDGGADGGDAATGPVAVDAKVATNVVLDAVYFLDGRDVQSTWSPVFGTASQRDVSTQGACNAGGGYAVTGTESFSADTQPVITKDLTWTFTACHHVASQGDLTLDGIVHQVGSTTESYPDQTIVSDQGKFTSGALTLKGVLHGVDKGTLASACGYDEQVQTAQGKTTASGSLCGTAF